MDLYNTKKFIAVSQARELIGISIQGMENNIKDKGIKKYRDGRKVFISLEDFSRIKKSVDLNGRVNSIRNKDKEDRDIEEQLIKTQSQKTELEKKVESLIVELKHKDETLDNVNHRLEEVIKDKDGYKYLVDDTNRTLKDTQQLLSREQDLHLKEKQIRLSLEQSINSNTLLLEANTKRVHELEFKVADVEDKLSKEELLKAELLKKLDEERSLVAKLEESSKELNNTLIGERKAKEVIINELETLKGKGLMGRVIAAIKGF